MVTPLEGFPPILDQRAKILILGSMPGAESLRKRQYYGHKRNAFWPIMDDLLAIDSSQSYEKRVAALRDERIAVWDVVKSCSRQGSLDSAIDRSTVVVNDFRVLFQNTPLLDKVLCNGAMAYALFMRRVVPGLIETEIKLDRQKSNHCVKASVTLQLSIGVEVKIMKMPSTSPANARTSLPEKSRQWRKGLDL